MLNTTSNTLFIIGVKLHVAEITFLLTLSPAINYIYMKLQNKEGYDVLKLTLY